MDRKAFEALFDEAVVALKDDLHLEWHPRTSIGAVAPEDESKPEVVIAPPRPPPRSAADFEDRSLDRIRMLERQNEAMSNRLRDARRDLDATLATCSKVALGAGTGPSSTAASEIARSIEAARDAALDYGKRWKERDAHAYEQLLERERAEFARGLERLKAELADKYAERQHSRNLELEDRKADGQVRVEREKGVFTTRSAVIGVASVVLGGLIGRSTADVGRAMTPPSATQPTAPTDSSPTIRDN
jgi:hypothetical protein